MKKINIGNLIALSLGGCVLLFLAFAGIKFLAFQKQLNLGSGISPDSPCYGRQWESPAEELNCRFPPPPIGRWHAVYSEEFAKEHNLPPENISDDLSDGVDYMEMDVQPYGNGGTACLVNMLIKKPNDVAVYNVGDKYQWGRELHAHRKLAHMLGLDKHKNKLKGITTFGLAPRNMQYDPKKTYGIGSSFAFHAEDILEGYDYVTANAGCYYILSDTSRFPNKWAFDVARASVRGRYESRFNAPNAPERPKGEDFFDSIFLINIPKEILTNVFKDMPIGGR